MGSMLQNFGLALLCVLFLMTAGVAADPTPEQDKEYIEYRKKALEEQLQGMRARAEAGSVDDQVAMGKEYRGSRFRTTSRRGIEQDYRQAMEWFLKAATQGNAVAQYEIGVLYAQGWGVPKDVAAALEWWEKAAAQGHDGAQTSIDYNTYLLENADKFQNAP